MSPISSESGSRWRWACLIGLAAILPFLNSLGGDFTFDDPPLVRDNPMVASDAPVVPLFTTFDGWAYRPLTMLTYLANARWDSGARGYHAVNVGLHALVTLEVFQLGVLLLGSVLGAAAAALIFAVHPVHTEAVSSIVGRAELMAATLVLASLLTSLRAHRDDTRRRVPWTAISLSVFTAGLFAKENALATIPLLLLVHCSATRPLGVRPLFRMAVPYCIIALGYLGIRLLLTGSATWKVAPDLLDNPLWYAPVMVRLQTAVVVLWQYLSLLAVPLRLSADYSFNAIPVVDSIGDPRLLSAVTVFAVVLAGLGFAVRRAPAVVLAAGFAACALAPTANILLPIGTIKAERLLYLPSVGWCLVCGWLAMQAAQRRPRLALVFGAAIILALTARTWVRNRDWHDDPTLFAATLETSPGSAKAHRNMAWVSLQRGDLDQAMLGYRQALAIYPQYADAALAIGFIYERKGLDEGAQHWYARAVELSPGLVATRVNFGALQYRLGQYASAEGTARAGLSVEPDNPRLLIVLGLARWAQGDRAQAQEILARVASITTRDPAVPDLLAQARRAVDTDAHP